MIDYIKINNLAIGADIQNLLDFEGKFNDKTGEVLVHRKKSAYFRNMVFTLTPGDRYAKLGGSLHKFYNGGEFNNDTFTWDKFLKVYSELSQFIGPNDRINVIEFGVNVVVPFNPSDFLRSLIAHKKTQFNKRIVKGMHYTQSSSSHYTIKIYNKGLQQPTGANILRIEVRQEKMQRLFSNGLTWSQLAEPKTWVRLSEVLKQKFSEVIYYDSSIIQDKVPPKDLEIIKRGYNPFYWQNNNSPNANRQRRQFQALIRKYGNKYNTLPDLISMEIANLMKTYHNLDKADLASDDHILSSLIKTYPLLSCTNSSAPILTPQIRLCKVTRLDISMQKPESTFLSISGIKYLLETDKNGFDKLRSQRLSAKWHNETLKVQFREIAHSIRNEFYNATRDINKLYSYPSLFDSKPFIRSAKMQLIELG